VVVLPGYGAGVGFYFRNLPALADRVRLYCVDWLGTGLSGA
jgi:abhydrolase domain-containing protein 5